MLTKVPLHVSELIFSHKKSLIYSAWPIIKPLNQESLITCILSWLLGIIGYFSPNKVMGNLTNGYSKFYGSVSDMKNVIWSWWHVTIKYLPQSVWADCPFAFKHHLLYLAFYFQFLRKNFILWIIVSFGKGCLVMLSFCLFCFPPRGVVRRHGNTWHPSVYCTVHLSAFSTLFLSCIYQISLFLRPYFEELQTKFDFG